MVEIEQALLTVSLLLLAGIFASKVSNRLGVPALLLFLAIGMLAGSEGPGGIPFDNPFQAQFLGVVALAFILFAGGLETDRKAVSQVLWQGVSLATLGVVVTAGLVGWFSTVALGFGWLEGLLLGVIVSSTDAAAVFSVLRSQRIGLRGNTAPLLELESGSNDPMAVFLTTSVLSLLTGSSASWPAMILTFLWEMAFGAAAGFGMGRATVLLLNRLKLDSEGLYPVVTVACVLLTFGGTMAAHGNGFLAVYIAGIVLGNRDFIHKRSLIRFHDGIGSLMQMVMFLVLGLLVFPSRLWPVAGAGLALSAFLVFVARPAAVLLSLLLARLRFRQKLLISWVGLRGAVPIVLATYPFLAGLPRADLYFNIVFFVVLTSVLLQGTTIAPVARLLRLKVPVPPKRQYPLEYVPGLKSAGELVEIEVPDVSPAAGRRIMDLRLPSGALVVLIGRGEDFVAPRGATVLRPGDTLLVMADKAGVTAVRELVHPGGDQPARGA